MQRITMSDFINSLLYTPEEYSGNKSNDYYAMVAVEERTGAEGDPTARPKTLHVNAICKLSLYRTHPNIVGTKYDQLSLGLPGESFTIDLSTIGISFIHSIDNAKKYDQLLIKSPGKHNGHLSTYIKAVWLSTDERNPVNYMLSSSSLLTELNRFVYGKSDEKFIRFTLTDATDYRLYRANDLPMDALKTSVWGKSFTVNDSIQVEEANGFIHRASADLVLLDMTGKADPNDVDLIAKQRGFAAEESLTDADDKLMSILTQMLNVASITNNDYFAVQMLGEHDVKDKANSTVPES